MLGWLMEKLAGDNYPKYAEELVEALGSIDNVDNFCMDEHGKAIVVFFKDRKKVDRKKLVGSIKPSEFVVVDNNVVRIAFRKFTFTQGIYMELRKLIK